MFENILGQDRVVAALNADLQNNTLSPALLFHGPAYGGKFSTALELARVLSCKTAGAPWSCECPSCVNQRFMTSPYLLMAGHRYFGQEIRACGRALERENQRATRFLFWRAVRKLTRRFDPVLWEGDAKLTKAAKLVESIEEILDPLNPEVTGPIQVLSDIYELTDDLAALLPHDGVNAAMIRHLTFWAHTADASLPKIVLIEGADRLNEGARNSLLKTLEEPPPRTYFVLLARQRQGVMPTILSRVRDYRFGDRPQAEMAVLTRVFRQAEGAWTSLADFFDQADAETHAKLHHLAGELTTSLSIRAGLFNGRNQSPTPLSRLVDQAAPLKDRLGDLAKIVVVALSKKLRELDSLETDGAPWATAALNGLIRLVNQTAQQSLTYNISMASFIEMVYHRSGEI